ncbi:hypothetical protein ACOMHN_011019 [Nucella lapillus]
MVMMMMILEEKKKKKEKKTKPDPSQHYADWSRTVLYSNASEDSTDEVQPLPPATVISIADSTQGGAQLVGPPCQDQWNS